MEFAIVRFLEEGGAPGIVSTNWIDPSKNVCFFPNVRVEYTKNKLLAARMPPKDDWIKCKIKLLQEFPSFKLAKSKLNCAKEAVYSDSYIRYKETSKRKKRKLSTFSLLEELTIGNSEDSSDNESYLVLKKKPKLNGAAIAPVSEKVIDPLSNINNRQMNETSLQLEDIISSRLLDCDESRSSLGSCNSSQNGSLPKANKMTEGMNELKVKQEAMWNFLQEYGDIMNRLESIEDKMDMMLSKLSKETQEPNLNSPPSDNNFDFLTMLPVSIETLADFETLISKPRSRTNLMSNLTSVSGTNIKAFASNVLRRLLSDEAAETYSLTGKARNGQVKRCFEKTKMYQLTKELCFKKFSPDKIQNADSKVREAVSDWLMQSKFRRQRRESRKYAKETESKEEDYDIYSD